MDKLYLYRESFFYNGFRHSLRYHCITTPHYCVLGEYLHQILENSVCKFPDETGRFLQVAGLRFPFDPRKPPGERVNPRLVKIGDTYLDMDQDYCVAVKGYIAKGKDGYNVILKCPLIVSNKILPPSYIDQCM